MGTNGAARWRRSIVAVTALVTVGISITTGPGQAGAAAIDRIVLVAGSAAPPAPDQLIRAELVANDEGLPVEIVDDDSIASLDLSGVRLIVVSSTVIPSKVGASFRDSAVPVVMWEPVLLDDMKMATKSGETASSTKIRIVAPAHALAAGLTGLAKVTTVSKPLSFGAGVLGAGAEVVASNPAKPSEAVVFTYPDGGALTDGSAAPSCRTFLFPSVAGSSKLTGAGAAVVRAAVVDGLACSAPTPVGFTLVQDLSGVPAGVTPPGFFVAFACSRGAVSLGAGVFSFAAGVDQSSLPLESILGTELAVGDSCSVEATGVGGGPLPEGWQSDPADAVLVTVSGPVADTVITFAFTQVEPVGFTLVQDLSGVPAGVTPPGFFVAFACSRGAVSLGAGVFSFAAGVDQSSLPLESILGTELAVGDSCSVEATGVGGGPLPEGWQSDPADAVLVTVSGPVADTVITFAFTQVEPVGFTLVQDLSGVPAGVTPPGFFVAFACSRGAVSLGAGVFSFAAGVDQSSLPLESILGTELAVGDSCSVEATGVGGGPLPEGWQSDPADAVLVTVSGPAPTP